MRDVYIVGIGSTTFGRHADESIESLAVGAVVDALIESTVDRGDIGALYLGNFISGPLNGKEVLASLHNTYDAIDSEDKLLENAMILFAIGCAYKLAYVVMFVRKSKKAQTIGASKSA